MMFSDKQLKQLIIPLLVEQILAVTVGLADSVMIAGVGEAAVSGVSLVDTVMVPSTTRSAPPGWGGPP